MFRKTDENKEAVRADVKMAKPLLNKIETPVGFENENNEVLNLTDATAKLSPKIEVKKLNDRENIFQIISSELSSNESDGMNKNISILTVKTEKAVSSGDDDAQRLFPKYPTKRPAIMPVLMSASYCHRMTIQKPATISIKRPAKYWKRRPSLRL